MIFIVVKFNVLPQHSDGWLAHVESFTQATRNEPGNLWFDWSRSVDDPNQYVLVEAFADDDAAGAHVNSDHFAQAMRDLPQYLQRTPDIINVRTEAEGWSKMGEMTVSLCATAPSSMLTEAARQQRHNIGMSTLRIALAQTNTTTGDLEGNAASIVEWATRASIAGADMVAFGQQILTGVPVEGLALRTEFVDAVGERLKLLARELDEAGLGDMAVIVGYASGHDTPDAAGSGPHAAVIHNGIIAAQVDESHHGRPSVCVNGIPITIIFEDLDDAAAVDAAIGAGIVIHTGAAPFIHGKVQRTSQLQEAAALAGVPVASVNVSGAQDGIVFDGGSLIVDAEGSLIARGNQFSQELVVGDVSPVSVPAAVNDRTVSLTVPARRPGAAETAGTVLASDQSALGQLWEALRLGIADYAAKNGFATAMLGLSGGMDSALVAVLAADALGAHRVHTVSMPSRNSSHHSKTDAQDLAQRLGSTHSVQPIQPIVDTYLAQLAVSGLAVENLQARVRGIILMTLSNQDGHLVLSPGNRSEAAVGYSTLYGDMVGGYAPIADVPKTVVYELARWRNATAEHNGHVAPIPESIIEKAPSAELAPGQVDTDSLPEYDVLDPIIAGYLDEGLTAAALIGEGHDAAVVNRVIAMIDRSEYKRRQGAPFTRVFPAAHRIGASLPITNRFRRGR